MLEFFIINKNICRDESTFQVKYAKDAKRETNELNLERRCCYYCQKYISYAEKSHTFDIVTEGAFYMPAQCVYTQGRSMTVAHCLNNPVPERNDGGQFLFLVFFFCISCLKKTINIIYRAQDKE